MMWCFFFIFNTVCFLLMNFKLGCCLVGGLSGFEDLFKYLTASKTTSPSETAGLGIC